MTAVGLIFSNIHDTSIPELTRMRTIGSVPFAGRYRLIDFAVSSMVNSGITKIGVVTHNNYQSLIDILETVRTGILREEAEVLRYFLPLSPALIMRLQISSTPLVLRRLWALLISFPVATRTISLCRIAMLSATLTLTM